jgi:hypothetical protein
MTKLFLIAASTVLTVSAPAFAARDANPAVNSETAAATSAAPKSEAQPKTRYCVKDTTTGSRIVQKICKTRAEWLDEGFDPLNPGK